MSKAKQFWRVVIADDEALPAELLRRTVTRLGHTVVGSAQNGAEAIELTRRHAPDVVVMDLKMPGMDGWTAMTEIVGAIPTPVVVVSALDDRAALEHAAEAGASAFLVKPVREDDLERALDLAIARFAELQEIRKWRVDAERRAVELSAQSQDLEQLIQELREAQLQLASAARRATVASLAQGLAHEINNALTPIIGHAQMIALLDKHEPETAKRAQEIVEHAKRIASYTASFRHVLQGGRAQVIPFSLNGIVRDVTNLYVERLQRALIQVELVLDERLPIVVGHPDQIQEVLMSLVQNAVEAMRNGGTLRWRTWFDETGDRAHLELTDSGEGISEERLNRVFEPGFTTRAGEERGTSLGWGLYAARQIVRSHHGEIVIVSPAPNAETGTQVHLWLPAAR